MNRNCKINKLVLFTLFTVLFFSSCSFNRQIKPNEEVKYTNITIVPNFDKIIETNNGTSASGRYLGLSNEEFFEKLNTCSIELYKKDGNVSNILKSWNKYEDLKKNPVIENIPIGNTKFVLYVKNSDNNVIFYTEKDVEITENPEPIEFVLEQQDVYSRVTINVYDFLGYNAQTDDEYNGLRLEFYKIDKSTQEKTLCDTNCDFYNSEYPDWGNSVQGYFALSQEDYEVYHNHGIGYALNLTNKYTVDVQYYPGEYWVEGYLVHFTDYSYLDYDEDSKTPIFAEQYILSPFGLEKSYYPGSFELKYELNGGEFTEELTDFDRMYFKDNCKILKNPEKEKNFFAGWYLDEDSIELSGEFYNDYFYFNHLGEYYGSKTLYAAYEPYVIINYYINGKFYTTEKHTAWGNNPILPFLDPFPDESFEKFTDDNNRYNSSLNKVLAWYTNADYSGEPVEFIQKFEDTNLYGILGSSYEADIVTIGDRDYYFCNYAIPLSTVSGIPENKQFMEGDEIVYTINLTSDIDLTDALTGVYYYSNGKHFLYGKKVDDDLIDQTIDLTAYQKAKYNVKVLFEGETLSNTDVDSLIIAVLVPVDSNTNFLDFEPLLNFNAEVTSVSGASTLNFGNTTDGEPYIFYSHLFENESKYYLPEYSCIDEENNTWGFDNGNYYFEKIEGMTFEGWYNNPEYSGEPIEYLEEDICDTYYAKWGIVPSLNVWTTDGVEYSNYQVSIPFEILFPNIYEDEIIREGKGITVNIKATPNFDYQPIQAGQFGIQLVKKDPEWAAYAQKMIYEGEENISLTAGVPFEYSMNIPVTTEYDYKNVYFEIVFSNTDLEEDGETPHILLSEENKPEGGKFILSDWEITINSYDKILNDNYLMWSGKNKAAVTNYLPITQNRCINYQEISDREFIDFASDSDYNLYTLDDGNTIYKNGQQIFYTTDYNLVSIYIDEKAECFYTAGVDDDQKTVFYKWNLNEITNQPEKYIVNNADIGFKNNRKYLRDFAVYGDYYLCYYYVDADTAKDKLFCLKNEDGTFRRMATINPLENFYNSEIANVGREEEPRVDVAVNYELRDMKVVDDGINPALYITFGTFRIYDPSFNHLEIQSLGFMTKVDLSGLDSDIPTFTWDYTSVIGLCENNTDNQNIYDMIGGYTSKIDYDGLTKAELGCCFVNPQKIIGVKDDKKLVIVDDGIFVDSMSPEEPVYSDGYNRVNDLKVYSVNRFVTYDLESNTFESEYVTNEFTNDWDFNNFSVSGFSKDYYLGSN